MKKYLKFIYAVWSTIYDRQIDTLFPFDRKSVMKELRLKQQERVLEIGVGTGLNLPYYPHGILVIGIDFSKAMLAQAKKKAEKATARVKLKLADAARLNSKANSFDKALATYVLRVAPEPRAVMQEIARVTKPGSLLVILDQFREKDVLSHLFSNLSAPFKLVLGWGKDYRIDELIQGTPWKIRSHYRFGRMKGTKLIVLENHK